MSVKTEMTVARDALLAVLDAKLGDMPEWRAFRATDRALSALEDQATIVNTGVSGAVVALTATGIRHMTGSGRSKTLPSYGDIAVHSIEALNCPLTTPQIIEKIESTRDAKFEDIEKAKVNVTSSLSRDDRLVNLPWKGGKAWWLAGRDPPIEPSPNAESGTTALFG